MKRIFNKIIAVVFTAYLVSINIYSQESNKVKGTMGKDKIVICVLDTKACMPVKIDTNMTVKYQNKDTRLTELPFGLYLEADIVDEKTNGKIIRILSIDETKTVICFLELKKEQENKLSEVLRKNKGVTDFEIHTETSQVFIEYDPQTIAYKDLESAIKKEGFQLEKKGD